MRDIRVILTQQQLRQRTKELAQEIQHDLGNQVYCVVVLTGAIVFFVDLMRELSNLGVNVEFSCLKVSSYQDGRSTGRVAEELRLKPGEAIGKHILIVEDMIDTGLTMRHVIDYLKAEGASGVSSCVLIDKPFRRKVLVEAEYVGFTLGERFIVGYGMDYNNKYRELPFVGAIDLSKR